MTARDFALSLLPLPGVAGPGPRRGVRWAVLGAVASAGFALGALQRGPRPPDMVLNVAFTPGIVFDVQ